LAAALAVCAVLQVVTLVARGAGGGEARLDGRAPGADGPAMTAPPLEVTPAESPVEPVTEARVVASPRGVLTLVTGLRDGAWVVRTPCGREAVLPRATPVKPVRVVIDPGHGGYDPGAVGPTGMNEADLNLVVARHAQAALEQAGVTVALTRSADHGMVLATRAELALALGAEAFVSIHHNGGAVARSSRPGSEMYHQLESPESRRLAGLLHEETVAVLSQWPASWVATDAAGATWRTRASGEDWFAMVRLPRPVPAVLAELAYLTNPDEAALLADPQVQRALGEGVARAVVRFLTTPDPGSGFVEGRPMEPRPRPGGDDSACDDPAL
jgi:N-acetylmuramoyl-L-alanine amidase